ncbi:DUF6062 family protein [Melioribacteraceae bacterium 4301-Me]|uniref:DUF6062 family protein n=1 Tax=Pyranulibacter aquaticus TaxID=3163344 RepID=UPI003597C19E
MKKILKTTNKEEEKHLSYFKLIELFEEDGCPICNGNKKEAYNYLDNLLYENVNDNKIRNQLRSSLGFCKEHSQLLIQINDSLGTAIIYNDLLSYFGKKLTADHFKTFKKKEKCHVCKIVEEETLNNLHLLISYSDDSEFKNAFEKSSGLCAEHLISLLFLCKNKDSMEYFIRFHKEKIEMMRKNLEELIRKNDYRFRKEKITGEEGKSWIKAVNFLNNWY